MAGSGVGRGGRKGGAAEVGSGAAVAAPGGGVAGTGGRHYHARNFMRDTMHVSDGVLFYHSGWAQPGIAGIAEVASTAYPDPTQFDAASPYYDPKATPAQPRWISVDVKALRKTRFLSPKELRSDPELAALRPLASGSRPAVLAGSPPERKRHDSCVLPS
mgnify:CR=1 FL=1